MSAAPGPAKVYLLTGEALQQSELLPLRRAASVNRFLLVSSAGSRDLRILLREDAPGRERYSRSVKALVQIGAKLEPEALRPLGQELEIVPLVHPYGLQPGSTFQVRVLFRGSPIKSRAVTFANRYRSQVATRIVRTDADGRANVPIERAGDGLVALVHMEPSNEPGADWRSYWSSLTFALPSEAGQ